MIYFFYYSAWVLEATALLFAIFFFFKYKKNNSLRLILPYLLLIVSVETYFQFVKTKNVFAYNITMPVENIFYMFLFYTAIQSRVRKNIIIFLLVIYCIVLFSNYCFLSSFAKELVTKAYITGGIFSIISYILFLFDLLKVESYIHLSRDLFFWIANGIFIFLCITILKETLNNYLFSSKFSMNVLMTLKYLQYIASDILYTSYIIGFIRCKTLK